jgi:hypothetical protein
MTPFLQVKRLGSLLRFLCLNSKLYFLSVANQSTACWPLVAQSGEDGTEDEVFSLGFRARGRVGEWSGDEELGESWVRGVMGTTWVRVLFPSNFILSQYERKHYACLSESGIFS